MLLRSLPRHRADYAARGLGVTLRAGTFDAYIVNEISVRDVYRLATLRLPPRACVLDVGANAGLFAAAVLARWPDARVLGVEMDPANAAAFAANLADRASLRVAAVVGDRAPTGYVRDPNNSGGHALTYAAATQALGAVLSLAQAISATGCAAIDLLKVDIEGAEYDVFDRAAREGAFERVRRVAMEWHAFGPGQDPARLVALLRASRFAVELTRETSNQGTIFATAPGVAW